MRPLLAVLPFVAATLSAQPFPAFAPNSVIVEFQDAPLTVQRAGVDRRVKLATYRDTFDRFRSDLTTILSRGQRRVVNPQIRWEYFETFNGVAVTLSRSQADAVRMLSYVKAIHPDAIVSALDDAAPGVNITQVKADQLWAQYGTRGAGTVIAIIDTGIDYRHPSLGGGFGPGYRVIGGYDFVNKDDDPMDDHFHGTHVAGIAAARSSDLVGVAPDASLIAFKVLNANGSGKESDVLAAIERTVDPNGDGDTRDRVDVANLSLGGAGNPDDPQSVAIDNASAAGVVFAVAAGNSGPTFHTIGSPGNARRAITVGAVDSNDSPASFTSRGPNMKNLAVKPEVMAPGVSIRSSLPNGAFGNLSGTSMATPHIAGVAALLRAVHHDWTAAQVKSAIVNTSKDILYELMIEGAGRVDALNAAGSSLFFDPPLFSLGIDQPKLTTWTSSATVHVTNGGTQNRNISFTPPAVTGLTITMTPATLSLGAGQSADVTMSVEAANLITSARNGSFSVGAQLAASGGAAGLHLPFGFTRASRATIDYDRGEQQSIWISPALTIVGSSLDERTTEIIVNGGTFDMGLFSITFDDRGVAGDARVIYRESQNIDDDVHFAVSGDEAKHLVTFAARDENGARLSDNPWFVPVTRLLLHPDWPLRSLSLPAVTTNSYRISDLNIAKLLVTEELFDRDAHHVVMVQDPLVAAPSGDVTLTNDPSAVKTSKVRMFVPPYGRDSSVRIAMTPLVGVGDDTSYSSIVLASSNTNPAESDWTVAMTPDLAAGYSMLTRFSMNADGKRMFDSPLLSIASGRIAPAASPWSYDGDTMTFGFGPNLPVTRVASTPPNATVSTSFLGQFGESRVSDLATVKTVVKIGNAAPTTYASSIGPIDLSKPGPVLVDVSQSGLMVGAVARTTTLSLAFDTTRTDFSPPVFTSLLLLDADGRGAEGLAPRSGGTLQFSVVDPQFRPEATAAFYRDSGSNTWLPLTALQIAEDKTAGILYRADLQSSTNVDRALVDIRIDATDIAGNTASLIVQPAFAVGADVPPRHRAGGR